MIKFRCGHCGHRIAIAPRNLGKLVSCPECGGVTHPIERHLGASHLRSHDASHCCANCGQAIGKLQKLHLWENRIVCGGCQRKLAAEAAPASLPAATKVTAVPAVPVQRAPRFEADVQGLARPFRGGLFGAMVGLCVAAAAMYGALSLLKDVAGLIAGIAFGGLALCGIYLGIRLLLSSRRAASPPARSLRAIERQ